MKENWTLITNNFLKISGILYNVFRPKKTLKKTTTKLYNTLAPPVLLYGNETWTINPLTPNDHYSGRTAPLTSKRCILCIYSTNTGT